MQKALNALLIAFYEDFYSCVAPVPHVTCQTVFDGCAINEWAKANALNYARNIDFDAQMLDIR
jgi:hypothetical protein